MNYFSLSLEQAPDDECCSHQYEEGQHNKHVAVGKEVDELRDGVVGSHAGEHLRLAYPPNCLLVACHSYPDGVDGIR